MDLNHLQVFRAVVEAGSFSKAAQLLRQPKSRVSRHIATLERELGVRLIQRTTRQFQLAPAGRELYQRATGPLRELNEAMARLHAYSEEVSGVLRLTAPEDLGRELLPDLCAEYLRTYPKVRIELVLSNQVLDLVRESIDVAIRIGSLRDSSMIQRRVGAVAMVMVISRQLRDRLGELARLSDLESAPFLSFVEEEATRTSLRMRKGKDSRTVRLSPVLGSNNHFILRDMALKGLGITLLPRFLAAEGLAKGELIQLFGDWHMEEEPVQLVMPNAKNLPTSVRRFVDLALARLPNRF